METMNTKIDYNRITAAVDNDEGIIRVIEEDLSQTDSEEAGVNNEDRTPNTVSDIIHELKNLTIISPSTSACSVMECEMENSKFMLACSKCKRLTHYRCTKLPAYQVTLFMKKGYRLYVCILCVGEIDEEILGNCTEKSTEHTSLNMRTNHQLNVKTSNEELLEHSQIPRERTSKMKRRIVRRNAPIQLKCSRTSCSSSKLKILRLNEMH